ncbi:hypothetical protein BDW74DRAFT_162346 [Aspergillus multicolor]|uniref:BCS1 and AAA domain-containing protein n=1 Tax=Aspergillus multicolor TaxID=41759 RepID=UPI003CCE356F
MDFNSQKNLLYFSSFAVGSFVFKALVDQYGGIPLDYLYSSIEVYSHDEAYNYLLYWLMKQRFDRNKNRLIASTSLAAGAGDWFGSRDDEGEMDISDAEDEDDADAGSANDAIANTRRLLWSPCTGTHYFRYAGRYLALTREVEERQVQMMTRTEVMRISCLGWDPSILKQLMAEARVCFAQKENGKTVIYRGTKGPYGDEFLWTRTTSRPARPLSTVYLDEEAKQNFLADLQRYLLPSTRRWYSDRGIPYRRGFMFYGPPGTGKSSLAFAAAGYLGLNVYILSLGSRQITEDGLVQLFQKLPRKCLVLLEDVDSYEVASRRPEETSEPKGEAKNEMTLSALLNLLDGVAAQEGRVLIMTTNHLQRLDPALIRPGRVDYQIKFHLADRELTKKMFWNFFSIADKPSAEEAPLRALTDSFADKIPEDMFSPADIQGFLLQSSTSPEIAIERADAWVRQKIEQAEAASIEAQKGKEIKATEKDTVEREVAT